MLDAHDLYTDCLDDANKEENGLLSVRLFNRLANNASVKLVTDLVEELQANGATEKRKQLLYDLLFPFTRKLDIGAQNGTFTKPMDYEYFGSIRSAYDDGKSVQRLFHYSSLLCESETDPTINKYDVQELIDDLRNGDEWVPVENFSHERVAKRLKSWIPGKRPNRSNPICEQIDNAFVVYPKKTMSITLVYYKKPADGKLVMTIDPVTQNEVYDPVNSIPWEWTRGAQNMLKTEILKHYFTYVRESQGYQMNDASSVAPYKK